MHTKQILPLVSLLFIVLTACTANEPPTATVLPTPTELQGKIMWVDSYALDYDWTVDVNAGVQQVLADADVELQVVYMDTKNNSSQDYCETTSAEVYEQIQEFDPDVLIATEDNVQRCLVVPYLMDSELPIVFAAVNWDASVYGYPNNHITGMVEVELVRQAVEMLSEYAEGDRLCYLVGDNSTDHKRETIFAERFADLNIDFHFVKTYQEFETSFKACQSDYDMMLLGGNGGIDGWDDATAEAFILENTRIPIAARDTFMAPFALFALAKIGQEQGEWAAETALQVLNGNAIADIPMVENQIGHLIINLKMADVLDIAFSPSVLRSADNIIDIE